ncbi:hypothetical protein PG991_001626 [Apiospora marii]|uniref:Rhodopsin domain-containing protein n=1 Tax=Apiospora marii TaxID=335849 RepID=A0ABR1SQ83_9PEZI
MTSYPRTFYNFVTFDVIFATASVYILLNVVVITLRLFSSFKRHGRLAKGDYCGFAATLHFAYNIIFTLAVGFIRLTLLFLFLKLFLQHPLYRVVQGLIVLVIVWVACYIVMAFSCGSAPVKSRMSPYDVASQLCPGFKLGALAQKKVGFSVALTDCVIDVVMFLLPLYPCEAERRSGSASSFSSAYLGTKEATPLGINDVNGVSGTIAWWTMTECSLGNITCNLPIISGYIFQRFFSERAKSLSTQVITIGRKSLRLNPLPPDDTLDQTAVRRTGTAETGSTALSPSTIEHVQLSPLELPRRQI